MLRAGVVGLGQMGGDAAVCLARTERPLAVYDVDPQAARRWPDGNLVPPVLESCAAVARNADVVVVLVVDAPQVWSVLRGPDGLLAGAHPGLVVVVASTIALTDLAAMREEAASAGVVVVDCGVTCPPNEHTRKRIIGMVGAEPAVFERIRPVLEDFTQCVMHMGGPGAGMATKVARNMMYYATWLAASECALLAEKAGVDVAKMAQVNKLSEADGSGTTVWLNFWAARGDAPQPGFAAKADFIKSVMLKDVGAAEAMAAGYGLTLPLIDLMVSSADQIAAPWRR